MLKKITNLQCVSFFQLINAQETKTDQSYPWMLALWIKFKQVSLIWSLSLLFFLEIFTNLNAIYF
jgi:hypothetical protein